MDIIDDVEKIFAISHRYSLPNPFETNSQNENLFLGRFRIFENRPLDPVQNLLSKCEKKQVCEQKFEKIVY